MLYRTRTKKKTRESKKQKQISKKQKAKRKTETETRRGANMKEGKSKRRDKKGLKRAGGKYNTNGRNRCLRTRKVAYMLKLYRKKR